MSDTKFCKDCKHLVRIEGQGPDLARCAKSPLPRDRNYLITGEESDRLKDMGYASVCRMGGLPKSCGPDAAWFEPWDTAP